MKDEYLNKLRNIKLEVLPPIKTSNDYHDIKCLLCGNVFKATPKSKIQNHKKWGSIGCPECTSNKRHMDQYKDVKEKIIDMGFELLEEYKGSNKEKHLFKNNNCCGRIFEARPNNILSGRTICPPCNDERKRKALQDFNEERHQEALKHMEGFKAYTKRVRVLTEQNYRSHKEIINPHDLPRGRSGQEGAYHVDHIKSIYRSFHDGDSPEECAAVKNLRIVEWHVNAQKWAK
jgi:predicted  nucleic acid-binding Zn-ribbon protein